MSEKYSETKKVSNFRELSSFMRRMLPGYRWKLSLALGLSCVEVGILVLTPLVSARIINALAKLRWEAFRHSLIQLALLALAQLVVGFARQYVFLRVEESVGNCLRQSIVDTVLHKRFQFFERHWVGDIVSRTINDSSVLKPFLTGIFLQIVIDGLSLVAVVGVLVWMNPVLASLTIGTAPITLLYGRKVQPRLERASQRIREGIADMTGHLQSWLSRPFAIKVYSLEGEASRRFATKSNDFTANAIRFGVLGAVLGALNTTLLGIPSLLIFGYGGYIALSGRLSLGELFAFMTFAAYFNGPVQRLINIKVAVLPTLYPVYHRIREFRAMEEMDDISEAQTTGPIAEIRASDLTFNFDDKQGFLLNVPSFIARRGEIVGIAGVNGSGKSTLARLLAGLSQPQTGTVCLVGEDGEEMPTHRDYFSFLPQDSVLFDGSLIENVTLFDVKPDLTRLSQIEEQFYLNDWLRSLPGGWQTQINAGLATTFSGGQMQKVGLARLIYSGRPVFLLDEPTNGLDEATCRALKDILLRLSVAHLTIVIAHSANALALCERVYHLNPEIGQSGTFVCLKDQKTPEVAHLSDSLLSVEHAGALGATD